MLEIFGFLFDLVLIRKARGGVVPYFMNQRLSALRSQRKSADYSLDKEGGI